MRTNVIRRNRRRSGFTLLEILVVVGIIALLAAFVVPTFINSSENAKVRMAEAQVKDSGPISSAIDTFHLEVGRYPKELSELSKKPDDEEEGKKWHGPYIKDPSSLKDPWGHEFKYQSPGKVREDAYDLWSIGKDNQDGTDDDVTNYNKESK
jgi:general secretion pathway protein G